MIKSCYADLENRYNYHIETTKTKDLMIVVKSEMCDSAIIGMHSRGDRAHRSRAGGGVNVEGSVHLQ